MHSRDDHLLYDVLVEYRSCSNNAILNCAQVTYFATEIGEANKLLMVYFKAEMEKKRGISCRSCMRKAGIGTNIKICRNCQVVDYCSETHQTLAWKRKTQSQGHVSIFEALPLEAKAKLTLNLFRIFVRTFSRLFVF